MSTTAMMAIPNDPFEAEARAWCARHIKSYTRADVISLAGSLRRQAFLREVEPLMMAKLKVYNCTLPRITIDEAGRIETEYVFSEETQKELDECDRHIAEIAERYKAPDSAGDDHGT